MSNTKTQLVDNPAMVQLLCLQNDVGYDLQRSVALNKAQIVSFAPSVPVVKLVGGLGGGK